MANLVGGSVKQTPEEMVLKQQEESRRFTELNERTRLLEERFTELNERTRLLEERGKQLMQKIQVVDETILKKISDLRDKMQSIESQMNGFRKEFEESKEMLRRVAKELESTAKLSDVKVLEKYLDMIDITRIIMKEDVLKIIEEYMSEHHKKK
jgi:hypothetical protein